MKAVFRSVGPDDCLAQIRVVRGTVEWWHGGAVDETVIARCVAPLTGIGGAVAVLDVGAASHGAAGARRPEVVALRDVATAGRLAEIAAAAFEAALWAFARALALVSTASYAFATALCGHEIAFWGAVVIADPDKAAALARKAIADPSKAVAVFKKVTAWLQKAVAEPEKAVINAL